MKHKPERKNGKAQVYKDIIGDTVVLVTSRDPQTQIQILKEKIPRPKQTRKRQKGFGIFSMIDS